MTEYNTAGPPPPGYYQPQPPPKRKHTVRNIILALLVLVILLFAGCLALVGTALNSVDKSVQKRQADNAPRTVKAGQQFTIGNYTVKKGWKVGNDGSGGFEAKNVRITNTSKESDTVFFTLKVLKGNNVLANIDCNTGKIEPGQTQAGNCVDLTSKFERGWTRITAESTF